MVSATNGEAKVQLDACRSVAFGHQDVRIGDGLFATFYGYIHILTFHHRRSWQGRDFAVTGKNDIYPQGINGRLVFSLLPETGW